MDNNLRVTLVISTYNWPQALEVVLKSLLNQTHLPNEIIFADDGSDYKTKQVIEDFKSKIKIPVTHCWQPDNGFRKTYIMNKSISLASNKYIIQIDGDIIMHPKFIANHLKEAQKGFYIKGSRSMLSPNKTEEIIASKKININPLEKGVGSTINAMYLPILSPFFRGNKYKSNNLRGCNFSFWLDDFIAVNGYNNDLHGWGHEDIELAARLTNIGIKQKQLKLKAVCFHLYHQLNVRDNENINFKEYLNVVNSKKISCLNGINYVK
jgi:glycosyltransferase involved in cell wall biosynthesis